MAILLDQKVDSVMPAATTYSVASTELQCVGKAGRSKRLVMVKCWNASESNKHPNDEATPDQHRRVILQARKQAYFELVVVGKGLHENRSNPASWPDKGLTASWVRHELSSGMPFISPTPQKVMNV